MILIGPIEFDPTNINIFKGAIMPQRSQKTIKTDFMNREHE